MLLLSDPSYIGKIYSKYYHRYDHYGDHDYVLQWSLLQKKDTAFESENAKYFEEASLNTVSCSGTCSRRASSYKTSNPVGCLPRVSNF